MTTTSNPAATAGASTDGLSRWQRFWAAPPSAATAQRRRRLLARLAFGWALTSLVSEATPLGYWLDGLLPDEGYAVTWMVTGLPSVTFAVLLFALASGLRRGRRIALVLFVLGLAAAGPIGLLAARTVARPVHGLPVWFYLAVGVHAVLLSAVLAQWPHVDVPSPRGTISRALLLLVPAGAVAMVGAQALVAATDTGHGSTRMRYWYVAQRGVADMGVWSWTRSVTVPWWVNLLLNTVAAVLVLAALLIVLRAFRRGCGMTDVDESRVRAILSAHGERDSLGYFALRRDKNVVFSPSGKAAIAYRVLGGVSLASGDPIGDVEAWPGAMAVWRAEADAHGWRAAVLGAGERGAAVYRREMGLDALSLGDEAVVDPETFDLQGRAMRSVRQAAARVGRAGYTCEIGRQTHLPAAELDTVSAAANRWRDGARERGFSMALTRLGDPTDPDYVLSRCYDADGQLRAVLGFVPWGADGLSLDLMRRDRHADNGLFEFMIVQLLQQAEGLGVRRVSLNFAMFREVFANGTRIGAGPVLRLQLRVLVLASRWWQLESLYQATRKYQPSWHPRFICFQCAGDLPAVAVAAGRAEGFLP